MNQNKKGNVAVITGAAGALCSVISIHLAKRGYKVALLNRNTKKLNAIKETIDAAGGTSIVIQADVTKEVALVSAKETVEEQFGGCSLLINGAGGNQNDALPNINEYDERELVEGQSEVKGFFNLDMEVFRNVIQTNTMGTVLPSYVFGRSMAKSGGGNIVNFASMTSFRPLTRVSAYAMAKSGIVSFTQWLAAYLAPAHIRVNAIAPGFIINDRSKKIMFNEDGSYSERAQQILRQTPQNRFGEAYELIGCLDWLIDDQNAAFVTGITVPVDGGFLSSAGV